LSFQQLCRRWDVVPCTIRGASCLRVSLVLTRIRLLARRRFMTRIDPSTPSMRWSVACLHYSEMEYVPAPFVQPFVDEVCLLSNLSWIHLGDIWEYIYDSDLFILFSRGASHAKSGECILRD
jgi:hypothetical protein